VAGALFFVGGRAFITSVRPQFIILATPGSIARAVVTAVLMGLVASILPARRLAGLEPAVAYRGG
jgi:ABC-type antimicrobial peptide transport system permease subunit